jgi:hypothetical protein
VVATTYGWTYKVLPHVLNEITAGTQYAPAVTSSPDGNSYFGIWSGTTGTSPGTFSYRASNTDGSPGPHEFLAGTIEKFADPSIVAGFDGTLVYSVTSYNDPTGTISLNYSSPMGSGGYAVNNPQNHNSQSHVTALANGGYVVTWTHDLGGGNEDIYAQIYGLFSGPNVPAFVVNSNTRDASHATVAALAGGGFVAGWEEAPAAGGNAEARFRIYDGQGHALDGTNTTGILIDNTGTNRDLQIAGLKDGGFAVAYTDTQWGNGTDISVRFFNADGSARSAGALVNGDHLAGDQLSPSVTVLSNGEFMVGWRDTTTNIEYVQMYHPDGTPDGGNAFLQGSILDGNIVGLAGNELGLVAESNLTDGSGTSIRASVSAFTRFITGDDSSETIHSAGDGVREIIDGKGGDDTVVFTQSLDKYTIQEGDGTLVLSGPDGVHKLSHVEHLQFSDGSVDLTQANGLFDPIYYASHNLDVFHAGVNLLDHFNNSGWHEGRNPDALFDTAGYLAVYKDAAASGMNTLAHYDQIGWHQGYDPSANFDTTLYLVHNPDVAAAGVDPLAHYLQHGIFEGRQAYQAIGHADSGFDAEYYLLHNPDVAAAGIDPLTHFNQSGWHEGRNPNAWFDTNGYLAHYGDVAAAGVNPLQHYEQTGWQEGRDPSASFDTLGYLAANPDVAAAHINPLDHFINSGIYEGRVAINDGMFH